MPDHLGPFRAQLPVHEQSRIRTVRHAACVHPVDLVADFEARILDRAGEPMIGAARGERGHMPSRLQHAQDIGPQGDVERDARRIESQVHETDLIRRVRDHRIHAVVRQHGDEVAAIPRHQTDAAVIPSHKTHGSTYAFPPCRRAPGMSARGRASTQASRRLSPG